MEHRCGLAGAPASKEQAACLASDLDLAADAPAILLLGHIDQIGLIVTHIEDQGVLRVRGLGGWDPRVLVGQPVLMHRTAEVDEETALVGAPTRAPDAPDRLQIHREGAAAAR